MESTRCGAGFSPPWISGDVITIDGGDEFFGTWKASYEEMKRVSPDLVTCLSFGLG